MIDNSLDILADDNVRRSFAERWGISGCHYHAETTSTQDVARALAEENAPEWTMVLADHQLAGRGQYRRAWTAGPGTGLLFSLIVRPGSVEEMALLPIRSGLAIARAIDALTAGVPDRRSNVMLKWPNDIIVHQGKSGGILCEGHIQGERCYAIVGVGLNIHRFDFDATASLLPPAFIEEILPSGTTRLDILGGVVPSLRLSLADRPPRLDWFELEEFASRDWLYGRELKAPVRGRAAGINERGHLLVEGMDGTTEEALGGSVELMRT
jgi:BirA family biotin operon repressor/biotin-[acetyl-CoA-carboxylase] ligase